MKGLAFGSLGLIALYALVQQRAANGVAAGGNALVTMAQHLLSDQIPLIPMRRVPSTGTTPAVAPATPAPITPIIPYSPAAPPVVTT